MDDPKAWAEGLLTALDVPHDDDERVHPALPRLLEAAPDLARTVVALADERDALRAENEDLRASREMWASARSESISLDLAALRARLEEAERRIAKAADELAAEHAADLPENVGPRGGCGMCWPKDGSYPCVSRMVADDLRAFLADPKEPT